MKRRDEWHDSSIAKVLFQMLEVKDAVANEPKKSDEKERGKSPEGRRRRERRKSKMRREKLRSGMIVRSEVFS